MREVRQVPAEALVTKVRWVKAEQQKTKKAAVQKVTVEGAAVQV